MVTALILWLPAVIDGLQVRIFTLQLSKIYQTTHICIFQHQFCVILAFLQNILPVLFIPTYLFHSNITEIQVISFQNSYIKMCTIPIDETYSVCFMGRLRYSPSLACPLTSTAAGSMVTVLKGLCHEMEQAFLDSISSSRSFNILEMSRYFVTGVYVENLYCFLLVRGVLEISCSNRGKIFVLM